MQATTVQKQFKNQKFRKGNKTLPKWDIKIAFQWVPWEKIFKKKENFKRQQIADKIEF